MMKSLTMKKMVRGFSNNCDDKKDVSYGQNFDSGE